MGSCNGNIIASTNKTHNAAWQRGFSRGGKKEEYAKPLSKWRGVSYGKIGIATMAATQDLL